jgi:hypothetical protein
MVLPHRPSSRTSIAQLEQVGHDIGNQLMVISGQAQLLERRIARMPTLPDDERARVLADLAHLARAVRTLAAQLDTYREAAT